MKKVGGAKYGELVISLLLFADDIVLMAESAEILQKMLRYGVRRSGSKEKICS